MEFGWQSFEVFGKSKFSSFVAQVDHFCSYLRDRWHSKGCCSCCLIFCLVKWAIIENVHECSRHGSGMQHVCPTLTALYYLDLYCTSCCQRIHHKLMWGGRWPWSSQHVAGAMLWGGGKIGKLGPVGPFGNRQRSYLRKDPLWTVLVPGGSKKSWYDMSQRYSIRMYGVTTLHHIMPHAKRLCFKILPAFIEISCFVQVLKLCREDMRAAQSISKEDSCDSHLDGERVNTSMGHDGTI